MHIRNGAMALISTASMLAISQSAFAADAADAASPTSEVVVTAAPREEVRARNLQLVAPVLLNVQSAETISKYPDYNAAEALGRMPGVSLSTDTGEGRFVNIRGIDANLNGATYGGVVLLNTFAAGTAASGSGRAVEFDTIPTGAIDGIILYKTLSPDREAEGLGGQIELTPRSSKNATKPFLEANLGWGYENLHDHTGPFTASLAAGIRFGLSNGRLVVAGEGDEPPANSGWISNPTPFSIVVTGSRKDDRRGIDDTEPSYANDGAYCKLTSPGVCDHVLGRTDFRYYDYHRRRFGYGSEIDFKPNDDHSYYARLDVAGYKERAHKNHLYAAFDGAPSAPDASGFVTDTFTPQVDVVDLEETHRNTVAAIGGQDRFGKLQIDYRGAYSRATYVENYYNEAKFSGTDTYTGKYNNTLNPEHFYYQFFQDAAQTLPFVSTDATQYSNPRLRGAYANDVDEEYSGAANAQYPLNVFGVDGVLKGGASVRLRDKVVNNFGGSGVVHGANLSAYSASVGAGTNYYMGYFPVAPYANIYAINALVRANIPTLSPSLSRDFKDQENVYAGYLMYTAEIGKLGVLTGARIEATDATYGNFLTTTDQSSNDTVTFVNRPKSYINVFPTVQLKYLVTSQLQVRATYSTGIARPGFTQAGGNAGVDYTTGAPRPQATAGNPDLKPTTGNNFDLSIEYYLSNGGIIQAGLFDKEFKNYIFASRRLNVMDPIFNGEAGDITTFVNEAAYARGAELAYHQKFTMLPGLFKGLGVEGNITWVDSRFLEYSAADHPVIDGGRGLNEYGPLPGTSHVTWNLAGFYEDHGLALRLAAEYVGASLFGMNGDRSVDTIQHQKLNMDFSSSYQFTSNWSGYFEVKNLLNTPLRYDDGNSSRPQQIEYYGQTYEFGVRAKF